MQCTIMNFLSLPSPGNISTLKSLGDAIMDLLDSLLRDNYVYDVRRIYKHHLIEIPGIPLSMQETYMPFYSLFDLSATDLFMACTNNQILTNSSPEILVGRKLPPTISDGTITPSYIEDAYCLAVLDYLLSHADISEITVELGALEFPLECTTWLHDLISSSQRVDVKLKVTSASQSQVISSLVRSACIARALSCLYLDGIPSDVSDRSLQSFLDGLAQNCAIPDMHLELGEEALSRLDLDMAYSFSIVGFQPTSQKWYKK